MELDPSSKATPCDTCFRGKQVAAAIPKLREGEKPTEALELVFVDLCGAFDTRSRSGNNYILDIVDDATTAGYCIPIADKVCTLDALMAWQLAIETRTGKKVKAYNIDNGELKSHKFTAFCAAWGIAICYTLPKTSAQNEKVECFHLTVVNKVCTMMLSCDALLFL
jgi:hypothetical protein